MSRILSLRLIHAMHALTSQNLFEVIYLLELIVKRRDTNGIDISAESEKITHSVRLGTFNHST